jgi:hypothetical protein
LEGTLPPAPTARADAVIIVQCGLQDAARIVPLRNSVTLRNEAVNLQRQPQGGPWQEAAQDATGAT